MTTQMECDREQERKKKKKTSIKFTKHFHQCCKIYNKEYALKIVHDTKTGKVISTASESKSGLGKAMMEFNIEVWCLGKNKVQNFKNGRIDD